MPTLVILAAGMGSRYGGMKQVDAVGPHGECILDYSIYDALSAGFDKVVFVIRAELEGAFSAFVEHRYASRVPCSLVFQELDDEVVAGRVPGDRTKPWGTGHAVLACENAVDEPFCVVNADDFYGREAYERMAGFFKDADSGASTDPYAMVGFRLANTLSDSGAVSRGVCEVSDDGKLASVTERTSIERDPEGVVYLDGGRTGRLTGDETVSLNFWGFTPALFPRLRRMFAEFLAENAEDTKVEFFLPTAVDRLIRDGTATVDVLKSSDRWVGVTYPDDRQVVVEHIRSLCDRGVYPERLWRE
ncbi:MAG: NDP-sugar synthase [Desulfatibacillaceae bacterium]